MKVVLLEENRIRRNELKEAIASKGHDVTLCSDCNSFIAALEDADIDMFVIDVRSWFAGESIYSYYTIAPKLNGIPALFFNSPEGFSTVEGRDAQPNDIILEKENNVSVIADRLTR